MLCIPTYLWRLLPGNPILIRVVSMAGQRMRDLLTRCIYLALLIGVVLLAIFTSSGVTGSSPSRTSDRTTAGQFLDVGEPEPPRIRAVGSHRHLVTVSCSAAGRSNCGLLRTARASWRWMSTRIVGGWLENASRSRELAERAVL